MGTDSLYYIMDYSGHYYRVNKSNQLVVTERADASVFTFAQANNRIGAGKKAAFYCAVPIKEDKDETDAKEVNEVNGEEQSNSSSVPLTEGQEENSNNQIISPIKELAYDEITEPMEKNSVSYDLSEMDWPEYLIHFAYIVEGLKDYKDELSKKHSDIEQKICDVLHYIELCETDSNDAADLVELLKVCRENRRDVKDELQRIEYFQTSIGTNANAIKARQALKDINGLETRKYKPRKYKELFENCTLKGKRLQKDDIYRTSLSDSNTKQKYSVGLIDSYEDGKKIMAESKCVTPLDEKDNDWVSFARQQAEFYRNVGQYITNLQIDINEIDVEIENILLKAEETDCNAVQGYKVFKNLKELRLKKKAKTKELNCLYALTDYIDCESLASTCEDNLTEVEDIMGIQASDKKIEGQAASEPDSL